MNEIADWMALWASLATLGLAYCLAELWCKHQEMRKMLKVFRMTRDQLAELQNHLSPSDKLLDDVMEIKP